LTFAKKFAADKAIGPAFIVLSDAAAAFQLPHDPRQKFIWAGGLTLKETIEYFAKREMLLTTSTAAKAVSPEAAAANKALLVRLHDTGITTPVDLNGLIALLSAGASALDPVVMSIFDEGIAAFQAYAADSIADLVSKTPAVHYTALYRALMAACDAEDARRAGMSEPERADLPPVTEVAGVLRNAVPGLPWADELAPQFRMRHPLHFHSSTKTFHFASAAHRRAAKALLETMAATELASKQAAEELTVM
jgi:hypothetical protein